MHLSDHDKVAEQLREKARQELIEHYLHIAIQGSEEYGFLNVKGHEVPDPTVVEPPLGYINQPDVMEQMRRMVRAELSRIAEAQEFETFEEADDFEVDDEPVDYSSPFELYFDPSPGGLGGPTPPPTPPHRVDPNAPRDGEVIPPVPPPAPPGEPNKGA